MSPYERMIAKYQEHPQEREFAWYLDWYSKHGFVFITPAYFVMGRPVDRQDPRLTEPTKLFRKEDADCWYVHAMAGDIAQSFDVVPWPLPWFAFERVRSGKRELQLVRSETLKRLAGCRPASVCTSP